MQPTQETGRRRLPIAALSLLIELAHLTKCLFLQLRSHVESAILQLIQQRADQIKNPLSLRTHEDSQSSDDIQLEAVGLPAGPQVVEDDFQLALAGQSDGFGFASID